jgi:hypothetical protein
MPNHAHIAVVVTSSSTIIQSKVPLCQIQIVLLFISTIRHYMGAVFRPKDLARGNRKVIDNAIKDFAPDTKDNVVKLLDSWKGEESEEKLKEFLGQNKAKQLLSDIESKRKNNIE